MSNEKAPVAATEPPSTPAPAPLSLKKHDAKPSPKPAPVAKKEEPVAVVAAPVPLAPVTPALSRSVKGIGGVVPYVDDSGYLHLSPQYFTDPHVTGLNGSYSVRRFDDGKTAPYVVIPADSGEVAFRTGVAITGDFDGFVASPPVNGEGLVTSIETRQGELHLIVRPFGSSSATVIQGVVMAVIGVEA